MTNADLALVVISVVVVGGLYLVGWYARKSQQADVKETDEKK